MAIAISGDIDVNKVEELIKKKFESKKTTSPNWKEHPIPSYTKDSLLIYSDSWVTKTELNYIQLIPPLRDVASINLYEQYLTRTIINSLFKERFAKLSKGKTFYTDGSISIGNFLPVKGAIIATVELDSSNLKKGIEQFNTHLGQLYTYGFTNQEIEKTKKNLYGSFKRKVQAEKSSSSSSLMNQMYQDFFYGNSIIDPSYELEILKKSIPKIDSTTILSYLQNFNLGPKRYLMTTNASMKTQLPLNKELLAIINSAPHKIIPYKDSLLFQKNF